jgi:hypothetical protein
MSAYVDDLALIEAKTKVNVAEKLTAAARASGQSPISIALDFYRLRKQRGKLKLYEYLMYQLYDRKKWTDDERSRFISAHIHWPTIRKCNDPQWWSITEDKWLSSSILRAHDVPQPKNVAVFDQSARAYPDVPKLGASDDLKAFLTSHDDFPLFAKNMNGMWSAGAVRISGCTDTHVMVDGRDPVTFDALADEIFGDRSYLIQQCVAPHSFFSGVTDAVATVRCLNLMTDDGLSVPFTLLKLPMGANVADNFWRPGNLVCQLDPDTGEVVKFVSNRNGELTYHDSLPGHDRTLVGECLPHWDALRDTNAKVAKMHAVNRFGSTDIALTEEGPVVIEVNNSCAFELIQIATGQGLLTDEILAFFESCGVKLQ